MEKMNVIFYDGVIRKGYSGVKKEDQNLAKILEENPLVNMIFFVDVLQVEKELEKLKIFTEEDYQNITFPIISDTMKRDELLGVTELVIFSKIATNLFCKED